MSARRASDARKPRRKKRISMVFTQNRKENGKKKQKNEISDSCVRWNFDENKPVFQRGVVVHSAFKAATTAATASSSASFGDIKLAGSLRARANPRGNSWR